MVTKSESQMDAASVNAAVHLARSLVLLLQQLELLLIPSLLHPLTLYV